MNGQDFKKIIEHICMVHHIKKTVISRQIGVSKVTLNKYEKSGVPLAKLPLVMHKLKVYNA